MSTLYSFPVANTATNAVSLEQLAAEIESNAGILAQCEGGVVIDETTLDLYFVTALTSPEVAELTAVVAAHAPGPATPPAEVLTESNVVFDSQGRLVYDSNDRVLVIN